MLETVKRKSTKMASFTAVNTRKVTQRDLDRDDGATQANQVGRNEAGAWKTHFTGRGFNSLVPFKDQIFQKSSACCYILIITLPFATWSVISIQIPHKQCALCPYNYFLKILPQQVYCQGSGLDPDYPVWPSLRAVSSMEMKSKVWKILLCWTPYTSGFCSLKMPYCLEFQRWLLSPCF